MMNISSSLRLLVLFTFLAQQPISIQAQACPPFTPNLPISGPLAGNAAIKEGIQNISTLIDAILSNNVISDNDTSFSVDIYSLHDGGSLFTYHYSAPNLPNAVEGVTAVDSNTIYRIGSISKVFTVYTYLASSGDVSWNEPVTKYVPELAEAASSTEDDSDVDVVRWSDVTLGALASQLSGVVRDVEGNLPWTEAQLTAFGLPPVPSLNGSSCGSNPRYQFPCDRAALFENILTRHPVVAPFHAPTYSNLAFQLLAYALENITSTPFDKLVNDTLSKLPLNSTYLNLPPSPDNAVIPINDTTSWYSAELGPLGPGGSFYSTINDLRAFGLSILNSTILSPSLTRRWLKPHSFTPDTYLTVGAPWEIVPYPPDDRFPTRVYAKAGSIGLYGSEMGLIPDFNIGFTVLVAGPISAAISAIGSDLIAAPLITAVKAAAQNQTEQLYAGVYEDQATNSSIALSVVDGPDGGPSLHVDSWISNGADERALFGLLLGVNTSILQLDFTLFPTGLVGKGPNGTNIVSWRALYSIVVPQDSSSPPDNSTTANPSSDPATTDLSSIFGPFTLACGGWATVDAASYGGISFDEVIFSVDPQSGNVLSMEVRVLRSRAQEKISSGSGGNITLAKRVAQDLRTTKMTKRHIPANSFVL